MSEEELRLTVRAAEKRDAGRGIARLPESARTKLGLLSGDTVVVAGERETVAKLWPARGDVPDGVVRIDADSRANAGVKVGDTVTVSAADLPPADRVTIRGPAALRDVDVPVSELERLAAEDVRNRPLQSGDRLRLERLSGVAFVVESTEPDGRVQVTDDTDVRVTVESQRPADEPGTRVGDVDSIGRTDDEPETSDDQSAPESSGKAPAAPADAPSGRSPATGVSYEDIGGLDEELELVRETVELPLSRPDLFARLGIDPPKGVLLHGPPGTGKTLIAKAVANEVDATFISISGPEVMSKYKGESEERIREVFEAAARDSPAIIFFDEIDSVAPKRESGADVESRVVGQLLSLMDGLDTRGEVVVIGATNRVDELDPALRRGGRFDREIEIGVPDEKGRREVLSVHTRGMPLADDVNVERLAERTHGFTGADLASLAKEAAMSALRRARRNPPEEGGEDADDSVAMRLAADEITVTREDFESALASVEPSAMREYVAETPDVNFDDVGGLEDAKETLERAVNWPLRYGPLFEAADSSPPSGVVLHGPPGTGKTLLARAIAGESGVNFLQVAGPELLDRYVGESEKAVRELFERARQAAPAIVFFDELDAIAAERGGGDDSAVGERVVSQLLTELDRAADNPGIVTLAATNRRDAIDPALLRPGRFESHVHVPAPDAEARRKVLAIHVAEKPLADDVDLDAVADAMGGFSGADVAAVVRQATLLAIESVVERYDGEAANEHADELLLTQDCFERALESVGAGN